MAKKHEDFGEYIPGAAKDYLSHLKGVDIARLPHMTETELLDILEINNLYTDSVRNKIEKARKYGSQRDINATIINELLKINVIFPQPDYKKLMEEGMSAENTIVISLLRDEIGGLFRGKAKHMSSLERAIDTANNLRELAEKTLTGELDLLAEIDQLESASMLKEFKTTVDFFKKMGWPDMPPNAKHYRIWPRGDGFSAGKGKYYDGAEYPTRDEAIEALRERLSEPVGRKKRAVKFQAYYEANRATCYVQANITNIKIKVAEGIPSGSVWNYIRENKSTLEERAEHALDYYKQIPEWQKADNDPRVGPDYRRGAEVTVEKFTDTYGFRGGQFGNSMSAPKRREHFNRTYDAYMDLAKVLGTTPKSLSLNGELAMAFGARGNRNTRAAAHYETGQTVINLTAKGGPGCLAHEWFHGFDNACGRIQGGRGDFASNGVSVKAATGEHIDPELQAAFDGVRAAIERTDLPRRSRILDQTKKEPYWSSTIEMAARSFEAYVKHKLADEGVSSDYLVNFLDEEEHLKINGLLLDLSGSQTEPSTEKYAYPLKTEMPVIIDAYDRLVEVMRQKAPGFEPAQGDEPYLTVDNNDRDVMLSDSLSTVGATIEEQMDIFADMGQTTGKGLRQ